jgi:YVTN family beta-propeller protein
MKGDFSRHSFDPAQHYSGVRMQQGRVQLDADWNEQADIVRHRAETGAADLIGGCGGPLHDAAFRIVVDPAGLEAALAARFNQRFPGFPYGPGDFILTGGRFYVDGILCESEEPVPFLRQPDFPGAVLDPGAPPAGPLGRPGFYVVYLDVWQRHLTALEVRRLRETALGGADTATRTRVVWQVRSVFAGEDPVDCLSGRPAYEQATAPGTGRLSARAAVEADAPDPCVIPPSAGYRGLENQLYRVEVHEAGNAFNLSAAAGVFTVTAADPSARTVTVSTGAWAGTVGDPVELFFNGPGEDPTQGLLAYVTATAGASGRVLTLNTPFPAVDLGRQPRLRRVGATYKWSRDNGIVVSRIESVEGTEVTVEDMGRDEVLGFASGQWVEILDEARELRGERGFLGRIESVDRGRRRIRLYTPPAPWPGDLAPGAADFPRGLRLRRWDGVGAVRANPPAGRSGWIDVEAGVQIGFDTGAYRTGDHWLIPARTATAEEQSGNVEWPRDAAGPIALPPLGIEHHHCRLAVIEWDGTTVQPVEDCRCLFAPATEVNSLSYVSGAGQEAMPDLTDPAFMPPLGQPLVVGVANGHCGDGARVRFRVRAGSGDLAPGAGDFPGGDTLEVPIDHDGLARCWWRLGGATQHQLVEARLLEEGIPVQLPILFNASLSVASEVAYDPGECATLNGQRTVQDAIDRIAALARIYPVGGAGQEAMPGGTLEPLRVLVATTCGPLAGVADAVRFRVVRGSGTLQGAGASVDRATDAQGIATVEWMLDATTPYQEVEATLRVEPAAEPRTVRFGATLSTAARVAFDPSVCMEHRGQEGWEEIGTVQEAIDALCRRMRGEQCHDFLDELRSDGVIRDDNGTLGLEVAQAAPLRIRYERGTAYVGGCRLVVDGAEIPVADNAPLQTVIVDRGGSVRAVPPGALPDRYAALAVVSTFGGAIRRVVDARLDLTHLDETVQGNTRAIAARRPDRRQFVPLLAQTLPNLRYRDGRNYFFQHGTGPYTLPTPALAFDGRAMWASGLDGIARIPRDATRAGDREVIPVDGQTWGAAFDGRHVWFTTRSNFVVHVDTHLRTAVRLPIDGTLTLGIAFDGAHIWVANSGAPRLDLIDVATLRVVRRIALSGNPMGLAFDGEYMWAGIQREAGTHQLIRIRTPAGNPEIAAERLDFVPWHLAFDGSHLWMTTWSSGRLPPLAASKFANPWGPILKLNVRAVSDGATITAFPNSHGFVFDGSHMWVLDQQAPNEIYKVDVDTDGARGSIRVPTSAGFGVGTGAYDGTHLWFTGLRFPESSPNAPEYGIHKRLIG